MGTLPGNPFIWVLYLLSICALGIVVAVRHDPESDRGALTKVAAGLTAAAVVLAAIAVGAGYAGWRRAMGEPTPGLVLATVVVPATTAWALVRPFDGSLSVFPYGTSSASDWATSTAGWSLWGLWPPSSERSSNVTSSVVVAKTRSANAKERRPRPKAHGLT